MTTQRIKLREDVQFRILRLLQDNPKMSQRELAKAVGLSTGGIHYVLRALLAKGLLKIENSTTTEDKRRYAYVLTRKGMASKANLTKQFLIRKMADYELLEAEINEVIVEVCEDQSDTEMAELKTLLKDC
jgi:EPS-associated MarR family transcriptional regulator|tara:strand:+ start:207 stop:596 length:390 start_codon:yes stop_codon:yes gene_type:complete